MPHVDIRVSKPVDAQTRDALQKEIGGSMPLIPGKTISNTIITINDNYSMYKGGQPIEGAFMDIRLLNASPEESKKEFSEKIFALFESILKIPPENVQLNFVELPNWASGGVYR